MTAQKTSLFNAFETQLSASVGAADLTFNVDATAPLTSPCYLVIDPTSASKREYVLFDGTFTSTAFVTSSTANRGLGGSAAGAQSHAAGTTVRCVPMHQHFGDLNDRIDLRLTETESDAAYLRTFDVKNYGAVLDGVADDTAAAVAAMDAADADGIGRIVYIDAGTLLTTGLSMSGRTCVLRGAGSDGTTIKGASGHTGPVIDWSGYSYPDSAREQREFGGFTVKGDGVAGAAKVGVKMTAMAAVTFRNISVRDTGGSCIDAGTAQLCNFENIILNTPVDAKANDTPYFRARGAFNGNIISRLGLRSVLTSGDVGVSGAVRIEDDGVAYAPLHNQFLAPWVEYLHVPTNGTVFHLEGSYNVIHDLQPFDADKESGATGTSWIRLAAPAFENNGANVVRGNVPGNGGSATSIDVGVEVSQSGNHITGWKGFNGSNVQLNTGVNRTFALLGGRESSASNAAFIDNSGTTTNTLIDAGGGEFNLVAGAHVLDNLYLDSTAGPRIFYSGGQGYVRSDAWNYQAADGTNMLQINKFSGTTVHGDLDHNGGNVGFYGVAPVARPTALTAADAATVDATYGTEEAGVINNLRTRVNELETKLRSLGLLT